MTRLAYPFTEKAVRALTAGEAVSVNGRIWTGRDRFHKHFAEGGKLPVDFRDGALFHCGPVVVKEAKGERREAKGERVYILERNMICDAHILGTKKAEIPLKIKATQRVTGLQTEGVLPLTNKQITRRVKREIVEIY